MSTDTAVGRRDWARAFVPDLIPEPQDLDRTGPLDARERRDLDRIHAARDHHQMAKWVRGKAIESAFRRRLFRGEDGQRTRQQYLDDEWDGISKSATYREISEWPLAQEIADACEKPAPDSHVRALVDVAAAQGHKTVAHWYAELRRHGRQTGRRVTADANLADYLRTGTEPERLDPLFAPRQLQPAPTQPALARRHRRSAGEPVAGAVIPPGRAPESFPNLGMSEPTVGSLNEEPAAGPLNAGHISRLNTLLAAEARHAGVSPEHMADLFMEMEDTG